MPTLKIDNQDITVEPGTTVIEAAKKLGVEIPHFCYHPKLSISGNCRMCLVEVEKFPKPQISCSLVATDGMVVHTQSENAKKWRKNVLQFILINHPLDCPVCDQAGECKLQNYYLSESVKLSEFQEEKVHKPKKIRLGPQVMLDDERCIMCSRCIRFCDEITKTSELGFTQRGDHIELRPFPGKELNNPYSINTVDICPVGALTSSDFRFKKRVWFLKTADSICSGCSRGCNLRLQYENETVYRYLPRQNEAVNSVWLCDAGRLSYKQINENRVITSEKRIEGQLTRIHPEQAISEVTALMKKAAGKPILVLGSAQGSNENNLALKKLAALVGSDQVAPMLAYSGREVANPYEDDFLIKADKNPNTRGVEHLGFQKLNHVSSSEICLILGEVSEPDLKKIAETKPSCVIYFATHRDATTGIADYLFPITIFAEESGTFMNFEGRVQKFNPGPKSRGQMKPAWQWIKELAQGLGVVWNLHPAALLQEGFGLSDADLGAEGKRL